MLNKLKICNTHLLFFNMKTQKHPERKKRSAIMKYNAGNGISPALR